MFAKAGLGTQRGHPKGGRARKNDASVACSSLCLGPFEELRCASYVRRTPARVLLPHALATEETFLLAAPILQHIRLRGIVATLSAWHSRLHTACAHDFRRKPAMFDDGGPGGPGGVADVALASVLRWERPSRRGSRRDHVQVVGVTSRAQLRYGVLPRRLGCDELGMQCLGDRWGTWAPPSGEW